MMAHQSAGIPPEARADRAPPHRGRRRPAVRWIAHGVLFVALVAGVFGLLPRLGGLTQATAVLAVLGYGIVHCWLPLLPGAVAYFRLRLRPGADGKRKGKGKPAT